MKGNEMARKYRVVIGHLVGHQAGDEVTEQDLEAVGGNAEHLLNLGAISAVSTPTKKESEG